MKDYSPPLSIYFVWHPADALTVKPLIDHCTAMLQRDIDQPFTRGMNMPIFFRTAASKHIPPDIEPLSHQTLVFVFIGREIASDEGWIDYVGRILKNNKLYFIPVAVDKDAYTLNSVLEGKNFIRLSDFASIAPVEHFFIYASHEIYRFCLNNSISKSKLGKNKAIKLFLSHSKGDSWAVALASELKSAIDTSTMRSFFDAFDIAPAYRFDAEIAGNLKESTIIAIHSDTYSSRYWCQKELMLAKNHKRPMIAVDCLNDFEDRRFTYSTNIPAIHAGSEVPKSREIILRILASALLETIRMNYNMLLLKAYQNAGWFSDKAFLLPRPPEPIDIFGLLSKKGKNLTVLHEHLIYPEPSVYIEELSPFQDIGIKTFTPLTYATKNLSGHTVGISISDPTDEELLQIGQDVNHLAQLSQDVSRHILAKEGKLAYGGDLRQNGFTHLVFEEAAILQNRLKSKSIHVDNYIAWPIFLRDSEEMKEWKVKFREVANMIQLQPPKDVLALIPALTTFLPPITLENRYIWSRSLSNMRQYMVRKCTARICAGGKHQDYSGIMPGVLEEILIAMQYNKPIYLLGGFGGLTSTICNIMAGTYDGIKISYNWQIEHNAGYSDLTDYAKSNKKSYSPDYNAIVDKIKAYGFGTLSRLNGLSVAENTKLSKTPFIDEALHLVLKGLTSISMHKYT